MLVGAARLLKQNGMSLVNTAPISWSNTKGAAGLPYWAYGKIVDNDSGQPLPYPRLRVYTPQGVPFGSVYIGDAGGAWNFAIPNENYLIEVSDTFDTTRKYFIYKQPAKVVSNGYKWFIRKDPALVSPAPPQSLPVSSETVVTPKQAVLSNTLASLTNNTPSATLGNIVIPKVSNIDFASKVQADYVFARDGKMLNQTVESLKKFFPWILVGVVAFIAYRNRSKLKRFISRPKLSI